MVSVAIGATTKEGVKCGVSAGTGPAAGDPETTRIRRANDQGLAGTSERWPRPFRTSRSRVRLLAALVAMAFVGFYVAVDAVRDDTDSSFWPTSAIEVLCSLSAAVVMLAAARHCWPTSRLLAHGWLFLAASHFAYAGGDLLAAAGVELERGPASAVMNGLYLAFYPLFLAGVLRLPATPLHRRDRVRLFLDMGLVVLAAGIVLWFLLVSPLTSRFQPGPWAITLTSAFLLGDLALLVAVLSLVFTRDVSAARPVAGFLAAGATILIATDLAYAYQILGGQPELAGLIGLGFTVSHLLAGLAAVAELLEPTESVGTVPADPVEDRPVRSQASLLVATGALVLAWSAYALSHQPPPGALAFLCTLSLILLVAVRLGFEVRLSAELCLRVSRARETLEDRVRQRTSELELANARLLEETAQRAEAQAALAQARDGLERDVQERTTELRRANLQLEMTNLELRSFASSVSHDLRGPLQVISGSSELLLQGHGSQVDGHGRDQLRRLQGASERMSGMIDALLVLSRASEGDLVEREVDLSALAWEVIEELRGSRPERRAEWSVATGLASWGDPQLLRLVLENLLDNAWKFTDGRDPARIEIGRVPGTAVRGAEDPTFFVRDTGAGFDMAQADRLFRPFSRLHASDRFSGHGVGLATVHRIVTRHGGRIWAEAAEGQGATFYFTLPSRRQPAELP